MRWNKTHAAEAKNGKSPEARYRPCRAAYSPNTEAPSSPEARGGRGEGGNWAKRRAQEESRLFYSQPLKGRVFTAENKRAAFVCRALKTPPQAGGVKSEWELKYL